MNGLFSAESIPQILQMLNQQTQFSPTRENTMSPFNMSLLGMDPNMPNMVGPPSALPQAQQPMPSQLQMYGMENQLANPAGSNFVPTPMNNNNNGLANFSGLFGGQQQEVPDATRIMQETDYPFIGQSPSIWGGYEG